MFRVKSISICSMFLITAANAGDLSTIDSCIKQGYKNLNDRHAIVAAVLDVSDSKVSTFGAASENQLFEIGSVTKTFTANLLAQSIVANNLKISDPIPSEYQKAGVTITYEELTTHTSGIMAGIFPDFKITNELSPFEGLTIPVFKDLYLKTPLATRPGEQWSYSNLGLGLLGLILSENQKTSYESLVQDKILKPLGMNETYFEVPESELLRFPEGYMTDGSGELQPIPHWDLYKTAIDPAGGIRSTIGDMVKYGRANLIPESTSLSDAVKLSQKPLVFIKDHNMWMGMNWILQPEINLIWHNGQTYGFNSILAISKKSGLAVVAMTDTTVIKADGTWDTSLEDVAFRCLK